MTAQILLAESGGLTQMKNSSGVSQNYPDIIGAVIVKRRGNTTYKNYAGQYVLRPNLPRHCLALVDSATETVAVYEIFTSSGLCCLSQSLSAAFMRVCQPNPVARNALITSGENRMLTDFQGDAFGMGFRCRGLIKSIRVDGVTSLISSRHLSCWEIKNFPHYKEGSSNRLQSLICLAYVYPAPHKTGAGRGNPNMLLATPDAESVFFCVCYMCHSMAWYAIQQGSYNRRFPAFLSYHAANNGAVYCLPFGVSLPLLVRVTVIPRANSTSRRQIMVTLAGLPKGRPVSSNAGISTLVNVTAPVERGNSIGDSVNVRGGRLMVTTPAQNMLFVWWFHFGQNPTYLTTTATSEREACLQLPAVRLVFIARIRM